MKRQFYTILLVLAIMLYFLYTMMDNMVFFAAGTLFALPGVIGLLSSKGNELKVFTIVVFISSLLNIPITSYGIGGSIIFLVVCGITFSCLRNLKCLFSISLIICIWLVAFLYYQLIVNGTSNWDIFIDYGLSKNYPGSMLVIFNCLWAVWKYLHYQKLPLVLPVISTIMAFFLDGRSSLICMILITLFCVIFTGNRSTRWITVFIMTGVLVFFAIHYWGLIMEYYELTSFTTKGLESTRGDIWKAYFDNLDIMSLFFGLDTRNLPVLKDVGGVPHNTFLSFHRRMGLVGLCALVYIIILEYKVLIKRRMFVVIFFNTVLLLRMFFDGMLTTAQDFFILTLFFLPLSYNSRVFKIEEQIEAKSDYWIEKFWDKLVFFI